MKSGLGRILVNFYNSTNVLTARALTEEDGYFSYFGLAPGAYHVLIDTAQLRKLNMISTPDSLSFSIMANTEGDYVEDLNFTLRRTAVRQDSVTAPATLPAAAPAVVPVVSVGPSRVKKDTSYLVVHEVTQRACNYY
ncbi:MAG: hypothetical protein MZV63_31035 [Marinilabiliales bacterium]|nr:hypothetical protein [Marinilabiliales bacterium]